MFETPPTEPQTFDWQMDGGNDKSWGGKARSWIHDKPGRTRSLSACKTLAVWIPPAPSEASSPESEGSTQASPAPDGTTPSSAKEEATRTEPLRSGSSGRAESGDARCCGHGSPECRCTTTYAWSRATTAHGPLGGEKDDERWEQASVVPPLTDHSAGQRVLISSAAASPARTSALPGNDADSPAHVPASSTSSPASPGLFDLDGYSSRTYPDCSPRMAVGTSESCLERWPTSGTAWPGGFSTAVTSECRSDAEGCSSSEPSLSMILEPPLSVPAMYSLSARAARGILRRAEKRGRTLPGHLASALEAVAGHRTPSE